MAAQPLQRNSRRYTVNEVLTMLEDDDYLEATVYITPPGNGNISDEDSGNEEENVCLQHLNHRQLTAEAELFMRDLQGETHTIGSTSQDSDQQPHSSQTNTIIRSAPLIPAPPTHAPLDLQAPAHPQPAQAPPSPARQAPPKRARCEPPSAPAPPSQNPQNLAPRAEALQVPAPCAEAPQAAALRAQAPRAAAPRAQVLQAAAPRNWQRADTPRNRLPTQVPFPNIPDPAYYNQNLNPVDIFEFFFDDEVIDDLVFQTNLYANRDKGNHAFTTNSQDMRSFIAILLLSGYNALPRRPMYWERSVDCHNVAVTEAMSRNRFDDHMRYLHLSDNNNLDPDDKLTKVRYFISQINERCLLYFPNQRNLSIDESMIPYFGHHSSKQFIKSKPVRFGFKVWCLADPLGYVIQFEPYVGARGVQRPYGPLGLGGTVVKDLISELPQFPYHLTFDNYFTSLPLLADLATAGIGATGTIRKNRVENCPVRDPALLARDPRGSMDFRFDRRDKVLVVEWNDNSVVMMATNCDHVMPLGNVRRWSKQQRQFINIQQPEITKVYNATMGGVDRADQNIATYRISMRTKKWWWPFFSYTVDLALQNAWLLYRRTGHMMDLLTFRRQVTQTYLLRHGAAATPLRADRVLTFTPRVPEAVRKDRTGHFSCDSTQKRCAKCHKNTRKMCTKCRVGLHLHCFNEFHGVP